MHFPKLKLFIKENSDLSKSLNQKAQACFGSDRHSVHIEKKNLGRKTRFALLALAFARGKSYLSQEPSHKNEASSWFVSEYLKNLADIHISWQEIDEWKKMMEGNELSSNIDQAISAE